MKTVKCLVLSLVLIFIVGALFAEADRTVDALILPQWHQSSPWNARCPGQGPNRANAGSHALALAKTMKYWAYPTFGTGSASYVDDDFGPINQSFTAEINWDGMSNTLIFQTTQRFIFLCGAAVYTNYEYDFSTSTLQNVRNALINNFSYDESMQYQNRSEHSNFYWKSMIRAELDAARPVIYMAVLANGNEVAFLVDGYNEEGLFHINWSNVNYADGWFDLNNLSVGTETIPLNNQHMLTGVMPSNGPASIDESFETDFSNWNWQFSGHQAWTISTESAYYGSQAAKSGNIDDNQISSMFIQINVTQPDTISFFKRVSCEVEPNNLYDHLAFFIDNVEQQRWSGDGDWAYHEYPVTAGVHEFRWTYVKDGASDYFSDCAWVDGIDLPEGTTPLMAPLFVEAEVSGGNDIQINWAAPAGANPSLLGYKVFRNAVEIVQFSNPAMTTYTEFNMPNGDYTYFVRAVFAEGISNPSNSSTVTVEVPYAPTNLTAALVGINTAELAWTAPPLLRNRALMGYQLYRDNVVVAQIESPETLSYQDHNLPEGVFFYEVTAMYASGESVRSNTAQIAIGVPEPPANFHAVVTGSTVNLSWSQVAETEYLSGFKIFRNGVLRATIDNPTQLSYADINVANGSYSYYMHAVYGDVESGNSATQNVIVEVPYPPVNVVATAIGDDVQITWSNPESSRALTQYYIYRGGQIIAATFGANNTIYLDQNLYNGIYVYNVSAVYSGITSPLSAPAEVLVEVLYPPTSLSYNVSLANVSLNWVMPTNHGGLRSFNGYNVYRNNQLLGFINNPATTHYTDFNAPNGVYTYEVTAVYSTGESTRITVSNVLVEVLYPVAQLNYSIADDDVTLSWTAAPTSPGGREASRAFMHYSLYRNGSFLAQTTELSYTDQNLANGFYSYYVKAVYGSGESEASPTVDFELEVHYAPTDLSAIVTLDDVNLSWTAPVYSGGLRALTGYRVYRDNNVIANTPALTLQDNNLANGLYEYKVEAVYAGGISQPSNTVIALVEVLYPPQGLTAVVQERNDVALSWQAPNISGGLRAFQTYQIYRNELLLTETPALSYLDENLADGHYSYYIKAVYGTGSSLQSNTDNVFIEYPYPPANVITSVNAADVTISWDLVPGTGVQYQLYRDGALLAQVSDISYLDAGLANGVYSYYLITLNASESGPSDPSLPASATVAVAYPPRMLSGSVLADDVALVWNAPATGPRTLLSYNIYRDGALIGNSLGLTFNDPDLANGSYSYYVTAVYDNGESIASNLVNLLVEVYYPATALNAVVTGDDVALSWTAAVNSGGLRDIQGYKVWRDNAEIAQTTLTSYNDNDLANGVYSYYVTAVYSTGTSAASNTATAVIELLYPPSNLTYQTEDDDLILSWIPAAVSGGMRSFLGYNIYRDGAFLATSSLPTFTDQNLANGTYEYYVKANYSTGESTPTNTVSVLMEVLYPASNLSYQVNGDDVSLFWNAAPTSGGLRNFQGYRVMRDGAQIAFTTELTYIDSNLANGIYSYYIVAAYGTGDAAPSNTVNALVEVLYAPTALTYNVNGDTVNLQWTPAPNMARALLGYNVYRDGSLLGLAAAASYTDAGLANGVYSYYVTALYGTGESTPTNTVQATVEVLYAPANLTYSVSDDDVSLFWNAAPTSLNRSFLGYQIYRDNSLLFTTINLSYTDLNLINGTYAYHVDALYSSGASLPTNTVNVLVEVYYPATALNAVVTGDDVALSWTAAVNSGGLRDIQGYKVWRDNTEIAQVLGTSYNDNDLANGVYHYYVTAVYSTGTSAASNTATAVIELLYPPSNLTYQTMDDDVILSWIPAAVSGGMRSFLGYNIYRDGAFLATSSLPTFTDQNLANGTYEYYVKANYSTGESTPTNTVSVLMEVLYPASNLSYQVNGDDVSLFWNAAPTSGGLRNFQGYRVMRDGAQIAFTTELTYIDSNLANGIYSYYILAAYGTGDAAPSNTVNALVEVLYAPTALTYNVNGDTVNLQWTAAPNMARALLGYNVYRDGSLLGLAAAASYTDAGLANGVYSYYVTAFYGTGESTPTNTVQATVEVLYAPSNLTYSVSDDDVSLFWNAAPTSPNRSFLGYQIYRDNSLLFTTINLSYTDLNLINGTYAYHVDALYSSGASLPTNTVNVLVEVYYPATALNAVVTGDDVALSWTAAVNSGGLRDIQGYKVWRDNTEIAQVLGTSYNDNDLANGIYNYYVTAVYSTGTSAASNTAEAIVEVLYVPTLLSHTVNGDNVSLAWIAPASSGRALQGYKIYRDGSFLAQTTQIEYLDQNLANGSYQYFVTALYSSGESLPSNSVTAIVEVTYPVTNLSASVTEDNVSLSWVLPAISQPRAFTGYFIFRNGALHQVLNNPALNSWTDIGLANGSYSYYMTAIYDAGLSIPSNVVNVEVNLMPDLFPPTGLVANLSNVRDVSLSWSAPAGNPQFYRIFRNGLELSTTTATSFSDPGLVNGSYDYYVKAQYAEGLSSASNTATVNIMIADAPTSFMAVVSGGNNVQLSWLAPNQGEIGFIVYRNGSELNFIPNPQILGYTDSGLSNGIYSYQVAAVYASVISNPSPAAEVTIQMIYSPTGFALETIGNRVDLSWQAPGDTFGLQAYKLWRNGSLLQQTTAQNYSDLNLANGSYSYYVTALYSNGESAPSPVLTTQIQIAYPPAALQAVVSADAVALVWNPVSNLYGFTHYNIYRNGLLLANTNNNSYNDSALANGSYQYYITALYSFGESLPTNTASASIELHYPATALGFSVVDNDVTLSWTAPVNSGGLRALNGYSIYRDGSLLGTSTTVSYQDMDLANGSYSYYVVANYGSGNSAPTAPVNVLIEVLYPPTNLSYLISNNSVTLSWIAVPPSGATLSGYKVYRDGTLLGQTSALSYTDVNLANGAYSYHVAAQYASGLSLPTNTVTANILLAYPPSALSSSVAGNQISLSWTAPADLVGFSLYRIYRNGNLAGTSVLTSYPDNGLANGVYSYYVTAVYGALESTQSNTDASTVTVPYPALNLTGITNLNGVALSWSAPVDTYGLQHYVIYRNNIQHSTTTELSLADPNLPNGSYSYYVLAHYSSGDAPPSNTYQTVIEVPYNPQNAILSVEGNDIQISWQPPSDQTSLTGYRVYRDGTNIYTGTATQTNDLDLANGNYGYTIHALYGTQTSPGLSAGPAHVEVHYVPGAVQTSVYLDDVQVSWGPVSDPGFFVHYKVWRDGIEIGTTTAMTYNDYNLPNGSFAYSVSAVYEQGESVQTATASASVMTGYPPTNLQLIVEGNTIHMGWQPPTDLVGFHNYEVQLDGQLMGTTNELSYTLTNLVNGIHHVAVAARYTNDSVGMTNPIPATILLAYPPLNPVAFVNENDVMVAWTQPADYYGITGYKILRGGVEIGTVAGDDFDYWDSDRANGIYSYSVVTLYDGFQSDPTISVEAIVLITYPVQNLSAQFDPANPVLFLDWSAPVDTGLLSGYRIFRGDVFLATVTDLAYNDTTAPNGEHVYSVIAAYGDSLSEAVSVNAYVFIISLAQDVLATKTFDGYDITWSAPNAITAPDRYEVWFLKDGDQLDDALWSLVASVDSVVTVSDNDSITEPGDYLWAVKAIYGSAGIPVFSNVVTVDPIDPPPPTVTKLLGNFPNPFNPETRIKFQLKQAGPVKLLIFNDKGQLIRTLRNQNMEVGEYLVPWDGKNDNGRTVNSGLYIYKLITTGYNKAGKMMLIK